MNIRDRDLNALVRLVNEGREATSDPAATLPLCVLVGIRSLVPCDTIAFFQLDSVAQQLSSVREWPGDSSDSLDGVEVFFRHYWDCAMCSYPDRTGDLDRVFTASDFYPLPQVRATPMWSEHNRQYGVVRELVACVGGVPGRTLRVYLTRGPGRDFDERDRTLLWLLRPHLHRLYLDRQPAHSEQVQLTSRQRELLALVAAGHTNGQIGRRLGVTEATVRKHLEHVFARLHVTSRTAAVVRAFPEGPPLG
jgi:DNA-binding CsgD family transcriptional regulator